MNDLAKWHINEVERIGKEFSERVLSADVAASQLKALGYDHDAIWKMLHNCLTKSKVVILTA